MRRSPFRRSLLTSSLGPLFFLGSILVPLGIALYLILFSSGPVPTTSAVLTTVNNVVEVQGINDPAFSRAQEEQVLIVGDDVRTSDVGRGVITFADLSDLVLDPESQLTILPPQRSGGGLVNRIGQSFGTSWAQFSSLAKGGGRYEIQTPAGIVTVRDGAVLRVGIGRTAAGKATVQVIVLEGEAELRPAGTEPSSGGSVVVAAGQQATAVEDDPRIAPAVAFVPDNDVIVRLFSPFFMLVAEPGSGLSSGQIPPGVSVLHIPLSTATAPGFEPQTVRLREVVPGTYTIYLLPKKDGGDFRVTAEGANVQGAVFDDVRTGSSIGCEWFYLLLNVDLDEAGLLNFGQLQGPFRLGSVPPVFGRDIESECPPPSPLQAQVGGVQVTATPQAEAPTPEPTAVAPTAVPTQPPEAPTAAPTAEPTQVVPTSVPPTATPASQEIEPTEFPPTEVPATPAPPTPIPPTEVPPPTPFPSPDIEIEPVDEEASLPPGGGSGVLPLLPLALAFMPGAGVAVAGILRRRSLRR